MATKPTSVSRWADVGGAIVEPSSGKKDVGWLVAEKPAAQFFNWLLNISYQWQLWLQADAHDTRFLPQGFVGGLAAGSATVSAGAVDGTLTNDAYFWPIEGLSLGDRIVNVRFYYERLVIPANLVLNLVKVDLADGGVDVVATRTVSSGTGVANVEFASDVNYDLEAGHRLYLHAVLNVDNRMFGSVVEFTRNKT